MLAFALFVVVVFGVMLFKLLPVARSFPAIALLVALGPRCRCGDGHQR